MQLAVNKLLHIIIHWCPQLETEFSFGSYRSFHKWISSLHSWYPRGLLLQGKWKKNFSSFPDISMELVIGIWAEILLWLPSTVKAEDAEMERFLKLWHYRRFNQKGSYPLVSYRDLLNNHPNTWFSFNNILSAGLNSSIYYLFWPSTTTYIVMRKYLSPFRLL